MTNEKCLNEYYCINLRIYAKHWNKVLLPAGPNKAIHIIRYYVRRFLRVSFIGWTKDQRSSAQIYSSYLQII